MYTHDNAQNVKQDTKPLVVAEGNKQTKRAKTERKLEYVNINGENWMAAVARYSTVQVCHPKVKIPHLQQKEKKGQNKRRTTLGKRRKSKAFSMKEGEKTKLI